MNHIHNTPIVIACLVALVGGYFWHRHILANEKKTSGNTIDGLEWALTEAHVRAETANAALHADAETHQEHIDAVFAELNIVVDEREAAWTNLQMVLEDGLRREAAANPELTALLDAVNGNAFVYDLTSHTVKAI